MQHKTPQIRIRARIFTKPLFTQSTGKSIENRGSCTILGSKMWQKRALSVTFTSRSGVLTHVCRHRICLIYCLLGEINVG